VTPRQSRNTPTRNPARAARRAPLLGEGDGGGGGGGGRGGSAFELAVEAYLAEPCKRTWDGLATKIIPGTMRTVWASWVRVDGGAPVRIPTAPPSGSTEPWDRWPSIPDPFTLRRAIRAARAGEVPVGWWWLKEGRQPPVPRR
jgi:hypothetical protein